jgi:hypothetical protein
MDDLLVKGFATAPVIDEPGESHPNRWLCKEAKFKARDARGVRRTSGTPQRQRAEAQRRNRPICEAIMIIIDEKPLNLNCRRRTAPVRSLWHTARGCGAQVDTTRK